MSNEEHISRQELEQRVIYSLLLAAVRLSRVFGVPLKELLSWVETAYFREVRTTGRTLKEASEALSVSQRTAVRLSKQLRESFFLPEVTHSLPLRIEFMLWASPMGEARIRQVLPDVDEAQVKEALALLLETGRIREKRGRTLMYEKVTNLRRLPRDTWMARIGALNSFMENLGNATYGRFFHAEEKAFARTMRFQIVPDDFQKLDSIYEEQLLPQLTELADKGEQCERGEAVQLSLCWAPYEYIPRNDDDERGGS